VLLRCLHGFLGGPQDFDFLEPEIKSRGIDVRVSAPNLFDIASLSMPQCVEKLCAQGSPGEVLLGYSMGGRLAMQVFAQDRAHARALIVVSASAGDLSPEQREQRLADDEQWARRFEQEKWDSLIARWNMRAAFGGARSGLLRKESDYRRDQLASTLRNWSVARQPPMLIQLASETRPILWLVGERDSGYVAKATQAKKMIPAIQLRIIENAAHRVPWENSSRFLDEVAAFLSSLEQ
jgi:2-succinyl-6-hydroxy-2,4-cyclohexadiene-1-carboxylate synthase